MKLLRTAVASAMVVLLSDVRASLAWGADVGNGASVTLGRGKAGAVCMAAGCGVLPHGQGLHRAGTVYAHTGTDGCIQGLHRAGTVYAHTGTDGYIQGLHRAGTVYAHTRTN